MTIKNEMMLILSILEKARISSTKEIEIHDDIGVYFSSVGLSYEREYRLKDKQSFIDFYLPKFKIGIEVKANKSWNKREVFRQCERYLRDDLIDGLILSTARAQGMPNEVLGKPVLVHHLSKSML